jgi:hypothetical protein
MVRPKAAFSMPSWNNTEEYNSEAKNARLLRTGEPIADDACSCFAHVSLPASFGAGRAEEV